MKDVDTKLQKKNKVLFNRQSECLQKLRSMIEKQTHRTMILWAFDCVKMPLTTMQLKYPEETRFQNAYTLCDLWAQGEIKMPIAKRAILDAHAVAKEWDDPVDIALCHAIGQGLSSVHVETHALGLVFYELSAIVFANKEYESLVKQKVKYYEERLRYWEKQTDITNRKWAAFILKSPMPNREWLLHQKEKSK